MEKFDLDLQSKIKGIYLSTEMMDLISIIQCNNVDQIKDVTYEEMQKITDTLTETNTVLLGCGRFYDVVNKLANSKEDKYDFYKVKRGLEFCQKNGLNARYHTLLDKQTLDLHLAGKSKEEVLSAINGYVKETIDFLNEYNNTHEQSKIISVDLFNEIVSFNKPYVNRWQQEYGIELNELLQTFQYARDNKPEGVTYVYNEPFLENEDRRNIVISLLQQMRQISPDLIDTLGTQMHIETTQNMEDVKKCFKDFKKLQNFGFNIQITEFDMCVPETQLFEKDGTAKKKIGLDKSKKIEEISKIIRESGVILEGISYWSISDTLDHNLQRTNTKTFLSKDFYDKYKELNSENSEISLDDVLAHPFLKEGQAEKFKELYMQEDGRRQIEQKIEASQREVITSRLAGLYSPSTIIKENNLLESAIQATEETTKITTINQQIQVMKTMQRTQNQEKSIEIVR